MIANSTFRVGDSVVVKSGVTDPDFNTDIGGWQGQIEDVESGGTVLITWDSNDIATDGCEGDRTV
ncbi:MAG: hypothetical protein ACI8T1_003210 [Verrucomicrobiales bacterium]|jgi:hypothetical protein